MRDIILFVLFLIVIIAGVVVILPTYRERTEKSKILSELETQKTEMESRLGEMNREKKLLEQKDPQAMIRTAREDGRLCKPGDTIYVFPEEKPAD